MLLTSVPAPLLETILHSQEISTSIDYGHVGLYKLTYIISQLLSDYNAMLIETHFFSLFPNYTFPKRPLSL